MLVTLTLQMMNPKLPFLSPAFGEHMVIQRDQVNTFWGWTKPGETVTVTLAGAKKTGTADAQGRWQVQIKPPKVGGPYTLSFQGSETVEFKDILVGDVWICSGQSNMEMGVTVCKNGKQETANANHPMIRLLTVEKAATIEPQSVFKGSWTPCTPTAIAKNGWGGFSGVAYFFGRRLQQELNIPIGLVNTAWGGSVAEAWISENGLAKIPDFAKELQQTQKRRQPGAKSTLDAIQTWCLANGIKEAYQAEAVATDGWKKYEGPANLGEMGFGGAQSVIWMRREFDMADGLPLEDASLVTATLDGYADVWLNGQYVGSHSSVLNWGYHQVPKGLLKRGRNTLAIRTIGQRWGGGITSGKDSVGFWLSGGKFHSLRGAWLAKEVKKLSETTPLPPIIDKNPFWPTSIGNNMILPLAPMAMKGAIWYQGESNVGRAEQYARILPVMMEDWRRSFNNPNFPFYVVQLANFGERHSQPVNDAWAELREAQALAATAAKNSGYVTTIDIGDAKDIHPTNKQDVGLRLALLALKKTYGKNLAFSGPVAKRAKRAGSEIHLEFDHADGLSLKPTKDHASFAVAGKDGKFVWATAKVQGKTIILSAPSVLEPTEVRYAWDADPVASLFNQAGLPAAPFRMAVK
jgi:sialate O-acetylesterase